MLNIIIIIIIILIIIIFNYTAYKIHSYILFFLNLDRGKPLTRNSSASGYNEIDMPAIMKSTCSITGYINDLGETKNLT